MKIAILVTKENVQEARNTVKEKLADTSLAKDTPLTIPLSKNGNWPASHYFCSFNVTEDFYQRLKSLEKVTKIEEIESIKDFLKDNELTLITSPKPKNENN